MTENKEIRREEAEYEVEGYVKCTTASRRCAYDCFGTALWSADN